MSVRFEGRKWESLAQNIYVGRKKITKIYAGDKLVYPTAGELRCYIAVYPKTDYYVGDPYDWTELVIMAVDNNGNETDVTQYFVLDPAHGSHCKKEGMTLVKCVWDTGNGRHVLYFQTHGTLVVTNEPLCWIETYPYKLRYWDHELTDWEGLCILGVYKNGEIKDVTRYFTASPRTSTIIHLKCNISPPDNDLTDIGKRITTYTCTLTSSGIGTQKKLTFQYKALPRHFYEWNDLPKFSLEEIKSSVTSGWPRNCFTRLEGYYSTTVPIFMQHDRAPLSAYHKFVMYVPSETPKYIHFDHTTYKYGVFNIYLVDEDFNYLTTDRVRYECNADNGYAITEIIERAYAIPVGSLYPSYYSFDRSGQTVWEKEGVPPYIR